MFTTSEIFKLPFSADLKRIMNPKSARLQRGCYFEYSLFNSSKNNWEDGIG